MLDKSRSLRFFAQISCLIFILIWEIGSYLLHLFKLPSIFYLVYSGFGMVGVLVVFVWWWHARFGKGK